MLPIQGGGCFVSCRTTNTRYCWNWAEVYELFSPYSESIQKQVCASIQKENSLARKWYQHKALKRAVEVSSWENNPALTRVNELWCRHFSWGQLDLIVHQLWLERIYYICLVCSRCQGKTIWELTRHIPPSGMKNQNEDAFAFVKVTEWKIPLNTR